MENGWLSKDIDETRTRSRRRNRGVFLSASRRANRFLIWSNKVRKGDGGGGGGGGRSF